MTQPPSNSLPAASSTTSTPASPTPAWHALPPETTLTQAESRHEGLTAAEAAERLQRFGPNRLKPPAVHSAWMRFLLQFHNVLIYLLLAAGVITALLQHWVDTGVIFGVVIINAIIGFIQEGKAEKALDAIRNMLSLQATVIRDGQRMVISAEECVPGDLVFLQSGDKVPADIRLIRLKSLQIQEAALTGESVAVSKHIDPVDEKAALGDRRSMAFSGTLVTYGQGTGVVIATGDHTEIGRISTLLAQVQPLMTPLLQQIARFSHTLSGIIIGVAAATFAFGVGLRNYSTDEMFLAVVGLAVAAIPEGLPAILTITLAIGVQRMAGRHAFIRRLPAVETLGSVSVICSDKTGTLTCNEMTVQSLVTGHRLIEVTGSGYAPQGDFQVDGQDYAHETDPIVMEFVRGALLCSDAQVESTEKGWTMVGDPTEGALITLAMKASLDPTQERGHYPRTDVIPFESEHRFMATLHHDHEGHGVIYVKGAPERILTMCDRQRGPGGTTEPLNQDYWREAMETIAARGQRVLALATLPVSTEHRELQFHDVESGLILVGLCGQADPPRAEAIVAVGECQNAGVRVKMITGDHASTALAIGQKLGLHTQAGAITGQMLDKLSKEDLQKQVIDVDIFARVSPEHKLRLVEALQANNRIVAMTGDGVNDAPALKRADIGVAMGLNGTEAAKEASEMVLADDNFASIAHAVEEGRTVYDNLAKAIVFILPTNASQALTLIIAILLGMALPITAVQILWVNMITAVTLALALAFERTERNVMRRPPRSANTPLLSGFLIWRIGLVSAVLVTGTFGLFLWEIAQQTDIDTARTVAVNTLVIFEAFYLLNTRYLRASVMSYEGLFGSQPVLWAIALVVIFQLLFTYAPPFQYLFHTAPLDAMQWVRIVVIASTVFFIVELEKRIFQQ